MTSASSVQQCKLTVHYYPSSETDVIRHRQVVATDASSVTTAVDPATFHIGVGGRAEVYSFDLSRKIRMAVQMQVWL